MLQSLTELDFLFVGSFDGEELHAFLPEWQTVHLGVEHAEEWGGLLLGSNFLCLDSLCFHLLKQGIDILHVDGNVDSYFMVEHLIRLGRKRIAYLQGPDDVYNSYERGEGYREAMEKFGLFTIKDYDKEFNYYTLDVPNKEVKVGLTKALIPSYVTPNTLATTNTARRIAQCLAKQDMEGALQLLKTYLGTVPYCNDTLIISFSSAYSAGSQR